MQELTWERTSGQRLLSPPTGMTAHVFSLALLSPAATKASRPALRDSHAATKSRTWLAIEICAAHAA